MSRLTMMIVSGLLFWLSVALWIPPHSRGQDAAGAAKAEQIVNPAKNAGDAPVRTDSYLRWFLRSSGVIGLFILFLSIYFVATVIRLFLDVRPEMAAPPTLVQSCEESMGRGDFPAIFTLVREDDSFLGRVLTAGMSELPYGLSEARLAMDRTGDAETVGLEKQISMLAVLGTLGPMIGLIGTLKGMISSFSVIAMSDVQLKASEVAGGISEALLLTFEGVALSVPAIYFYAVFRNRVASISASCMVQADLMLRHIARSMRTEGPTSPSTAQPNTAAVAPPPRATAADDRLRARQEPVRKA